MDLALKGDIAAKDDPKGSESITLYTEAFETFLHQLGFAASSMRRVIGHVALL